MKGGQIDQPKPSIARKVVQSTQENKLVSPRLKRADSDKVTALQKMGVSREKITRRNAKQQLSKLTSNKLKQYVFKTQRKTTEYLRPSYKPFRSPVKPRLWLHLYHLVKIAKNGGLSDFVL